MEESRHSDLLKLIGRSYSCMADMPFVVQEFIRLGIIQSAATTCDVTTACRDFVHTAELSVKAHLWVARRARALVIVGKRRHKRIDPADAWEAIEIMIPTVRGMVYDFTKNDDAYRYDEETQEELRRMCLD